MDSAALRERARARARRRPSFLLRREARRIVAAGRRRPPSVEELARLGAARAVLLVRGPHGEIGAGRW
jgi:hypothetical protein